MELNERLDAVIRPTAYAQEGRRVPGESPRISLAFASPIGHRAAQYTGASAGLESLFQHNEEMLGGLRPFEPDPV